MGLVEEMCYWEWALRFQKTHAKPRLTLSLPAACRSGCRFLVTAPEPCLPPCCHAPHYNDHWWILGSCKQVPNSVFPFFKLPWLWCFITAIEQQLRELVLLRALTCLWWACSPVWRSMCSFMWARSLQTSSWEVLSFQSWKVPVTDWGDLGFCFLFLWTT